MRSPETRHPRAIAHGQREPRCPSPRVRRLPVAVVPPSPACRPAATCLSQSQQASAETPLPWLSARNTRRKRLRSRERALASRPPANRRSRHVLRPPMHRRLQHPHRNQSVQSTGRPRSRERAPPSSPSANRRSRHAERPPMHHRSQRAPRSQSVRPASRPRSPGRAPHQRARCTARPTMHRNSLSPLATRPALPASGRPRPSSRPSNRRARRAERPPFRGRPLRSRHDRPGEPPPAMGRPPPLWTVPSLCLGAAVHRRRPSRWRRLRARRPRARGARPPSCAP